MVAPPLGPHQVTYPPAQHHWGVLWMPEVARNTAPCRFQTSAGPMNRKRPCISTQPAGPVIIIPVSSQFIALLHRMAPSRSWSSNSQRTELLPISIMDPYVPGCYQEAAGCPGKTPHTKMKHPLFILFYVPGWERLIRSRHTLATCLIANSQGRQAA